MAKKKLCCYTYLRVSTEMQVDGYSLDAQRDRLAKEAQYRDMVITREFADEGKSGKDVAGRPAFQEMLGRIQNGNEDGISYILVFKLSRFGRNTEDVLSSLRLMQAHGVNLIACEEGIDSAGPAGKLMISVIAAVAEIERENIAAQTMAGRRQKAREGKWNGGQAPYGYQINREKGILEVNEEEAAVVKIIYDRYLNYGDGLHSVAMWLNDNGYRRKPRGNGKFELFSTTMIKHILDNPVYVGKIAYGRRQTAQSPDGSGKRRMEKKSDYDLFDGQHEAIISQEEWDAVQRRRRETGVARPKTHSLEHEHILSGLLKCPICGAPMYGSVNRKKRKDGTYYKDAFYYACKNRKSVTGQTCTFRRQPSQDSINAEVIAIVASAVRSPTFAGTMQEVMNARTDEDTVMERLRSLEKVRRQRAGAKDKLAEQMDALDVLDPAYDLKYADMSRRLDKMYGDLLDTDREIEEAKSDLERLNENRATLESAYEFLVATSETLPRMTDAEKKAMINAFVDEIQMYPERQADGRWIKAIHFRFPVMMELGTETEWWRDEVHDETVVLLSKGEIDSKKIRVEFSLEDMDMSDFQEKATYPQIKAYVLEHTGLKVSSLYISQVKRKCGLDVGKSYNLPKSETSRQPQCPPEKEKAIREALKYFGMI